MVLISISFTYLNIYYFNINVLELRNNLIVYVHVCI